MGLAAPQDFELSAILCKGHKPYLFRRRVKRLFGLATGLQNPAENVPVLIDSTPQSVRLATDDDTHFVQMPDIVRLCVHATLGACIGFTKFQASSTKRLTRDHDPPLEAASPPRDEPSNSMSDQLTLGSILITAYTGRFHRPN